MFTIFLHLKSLLKHLNQTTVNPSRISKKDIKIAEELIQSSLIFILTIARKRLVLLY